MSERKTLGAVLSAAFSTLPCEGEEEDFEICVNRVSPGLWDAEIVRVQRSYGELWAVGLVNSNGDRVFPEPYQRVIVLPLEEKEDQD